MQFDLTSPIRRELGYQLIDLVDSYFNSLPDRAVQAPGPMRTYPAHQDPIPEEGEGASEAFQQICNELLESGFHIPSAHYLGMMNPTPTYMSFLAESLVSALNPQLASVARSQLASRIEAETVQWMGSLVGWNGPFHGTFTSGGNEANFSALAMALCRHFPFFIEEGIAPLKGQPSFYLSNEGHHSFEKSAGLLGIGRKALRRIPVNERLQMDVGQLEETILRDRERGEIPFCVIATAGTTGSGSIDDLADIAEVCRRYGVWMHVDGAYGAALIFSDRHRGLLRGIEHADSLTIDPHKWLAMPFAAGMILTPHGEMLSSTFNVPCPYLQKAPDGTLPDYLGIGAQWSRRMNSLKLWLTLKAHGKAGYRELIDRQMDQAASFAEWVSGSENFALAAPQVLPILNFRMRANGISFEERTQLHASVIEEVNRDGQRWISSAIVNGENVIRTMVISYLSEERHLKGLQEALEAAAYKVSPLPSLGD